MPIAWARESCPSLQRSEAMEAKSVLLPQRETKATLVDLLDRVLEKGLVLNADIIISVAGIPLIGINLRAALAGMETMLKYGVMRDWDEQTREWERKHARRREPPLLADEQVLLRMYGSHWYNKGIYRAWRPGHFYLTNKRLLLFRTEPAEVLIETSFESITGLAIRRETHFTGVERDMVYLMHDPDLPTYLYAEKPWQLKEAIEERMAALGLPLEKNPFIPVLDEEIDRLLGEGERISADAKMWYKAPPAGIIGETWRPGRLYLTSKRLFWWCNEDRKALFEVPFARIMGVRVETRDLGGIIRERPILVVSCSNGHDPLEVPFDPSTTLRADGLRTALFAGEEVAEWARALGSIAAKTETCPGCGRPAPVKQLLGEGCPCCDWVSPRLRKKGLKAKLVPAE